MLDFYGRPRVGFCPVHEPVRGECGPVCAEARRELARNCHEFSAYWYDRKRGIPPMDRAEYAARFGRVAHA